MIDLTKSQLLKTPVKCWVRDEERRAWQDRWLVAIWNNQFFCIRIEKYDANDGLVNPKAVTSLHGWNICTLQNPNKKTKKWETIHDVPPELWGTAFVKHKDSPLSYALIMSPRLITNGTDKLVKNMHYLPKGKPFTAEWLDFESEVVE